MNKSAKFGVDLQEMTLFAKAISHPTCLSIFQYVADTKTCISRDISDFLHLNRSRVAQHSKELRNLGLVHGKIDGLKINYYLSSTDITRFIDIFDHFFG